MGSHAPYAVASVHFEGNIDDAVASYNLVVSEPFVKSGPGHESPKYFAAIEYPGACIAGIYECESGGTLVAIAVHQPILENIVKGFLFVAGAKHFEIEYSFFTSVLAGEEMPRLHSFN